MDFDSPDVEREFPGLYASESGKRSQESDFSDEAHERPSKKDLLIGKRKEKKESKKDQGYAALEGESSAEEDADVKSPSKSKKSKSFKFPTIKEKREKSREKDGKDKEKDREKEKDTDKDRKKESKSKLKLKDKKKSKHGDDGSENIDDMPVFGVPLTIAVERNHCHDGVAIPVIVRDCIDYVQEFGLCVEGIYKVSGVKSKVQLLKRCYNRRECVNLTDYDLFTATSLLKTFLRELPEPLLTVDLTSKFEEAVGIKESPVREETLSSLVAQLPSCNKTCLAWIMRHFDNISSHERQNKMGVNTLSATLSPVLQMSSRLMSVLLCHSRGLFPDVTLTRYIPPLSTSCTVLPSSCETIAVELAKQESLLSQIHSEMNHGYTVRAEQLWEVQRFITQLKRKMKSLEKSQESCQQTHDEQQSTLAAVHAPVVLPSSCGDAMKDALAPASTEVSVKPHNPSDTEDTICAIVTKNVASKSDDEVDRGTSSDFCEKASFALDVDVSEPKYYSGMDEKTNQIYLELEQKELLQFISDLKSRLCCEREATEALQSELALLKSCSSGNSASAVSQISSDSNTVENGNIVVESKNIVEFESKERDELFRINTQLTKDRFCLVQQIMNERQLCTQLRVQLELMRLRDAKHCGLQTTLVSDVK